MSFTNLKMASASVDLATAQAKLSAGVTTQGVLLHAGAEASLVDAQATVRVIHFYKLNVDVVGNAGIGVGAQADFNLGPKGIKLDADIGAGPSAGLGLNLSIDP